jgi:octaheme c-type cytochrome (tetrathionate reductase family)
MKKIIQVILVLLLPQIIVFVVVTNSFNKKQIVPDKPIVVNYITKEHQTTIKTVDHSKFEILKQEFKRPQDMTLACLSCHTERHKEVMVNNHWTWDRKEKLHKRDAVSVGKKSVLNNFCVGVGSNEKMCTKCHAGYGYSDKSFDFTKAENIDCIVCHDQSGLYEKALAGMPKKGIDLNKIAQSVGNPKKENCGSCHYLGGGGNNVKHGDLDIEMNNCSREIDVHMAKEGEDMNCTACHTTQNHKITGKLYALSSEDKNRVTCEQCHTDRPHNDKIIDNHSYRVACQTCHIPVYAKGKPTKMYWDWSTAGRLDADSMPITEKDADGNVSYNSMKGNFVWEDSVVPEYFWFNGLADHFLLTDIIKEFPVQLNSLAGSYKDKGINSESKSVSKIWPVKVHRGKQPYDMVHKTLLQPKLYSDKKGDSAFWMDFNWSNSITAGMKYMNLPYSGKYDFVETEMYWPLNHQVSAADKALRCIDCHTSKPEGRLSKLNDFYLPGRNRFAIIDNFGLGLLVVTILGVIIHGVLRNVSKKKINHN